MVVYKVGKDVRVIRASRVRSPFSRPLRILGVSPVARSHSVASRVTEVDSQPCEDEPLAFAHRCNSPCPLETQGGGDREKRQTAEIFPARAKGDLATPFQVLSDQIITK